VNRAQHLRKIAEQNRASCRSQTALQFLDIVESGRNLDGRARLGEINRAINLAIKPMSDLALYGVEDVWSPPLNTLARVPETAKITRCKVRCSAGGGSFP